MSLPPVKAFEYEVNVEVKPLNHDRWDTVFDFEFAYTAADAITQVELRYKYMDKYERVFVTKVQPRHRPCPR